MYPEYATTAARVMISPRNNPGVGDRWGASECITPREYNTSGLTGCGKPGFASGHRFSDAVSRDLRFFRGRASNVDSFRGPLIYQPAQRRAQFVRLKTERARFGLVGNMTLGVD